MIKSLTTKGDTWYASKYTVGRTAKVSGDKSATVRRIRRRDNGYLVVLAGDGGIIQIGAEFVEAVEDDPSESSAVVRFFQPAEHTHDGRIHPDQLMQLDCDAPSIRFLRVHAAPVSTQVNPAAIASKRRPGEVEGHVVTGELVFDHGDEEQHDWRSYPPTASDPHEPRPAVLVWFTDWDSRDYDRYTAVYYGDTGEDLDGFAEDLLISLAPVTE